MVLNQSFISLEFSIPVNDGLYENLKNIDFKLFNNDNIILMKNNINEESFMIPTHNSNQFKIDILIPLSYEIGCKTCLFIHGSGSSKSSTRNKVIYLI